MKKPYYRIDIKNCNTDYGYTIVPWSDVPDYIELVKQQAEDLDEEAFKFFKKTKSLPKAIISVVMMTEEQYSIWFEHNVEANA